ncbi:MAG: hypothetical protein LBM09_02680, partial [Candidatus Nomurabacteria bacterium]|nr:hypothetical protein [Candidatus Nomurabacteria bacterium]
MDLAKIKNSNIYFLGWRETDISIDIDGNIPDPTFKGSFTCYGSGKNGNRAYNIESGKQLSDNIKEYGERNDRWYRAWFGKKCEEVAKDPNTLFLPYNIYFSTLIPSKLQNRIICQNNPDIVQTLNSKIIFKEMIDGTIPQAPFLVRSGAEILRDFENYQKEVVVQTEFGSNGDGTFLLTKKNLRDQEFVKNFLDHIEIDENYIISDFIKNRCSASFQIQVTNTETLMYSPGV